MGHLSIQSELQQFMNESSLVGGWNLLIRARPDQHIRNRIRRYKIITYPPFVAKAFRYTLRKRSRTLCDQKFHSWILPSFITTVRSDIRANSSLCVTITKVCPRRSRESDRKSVV